MTDKQLAKRYEAIEERVNEIRELLADLKSDVECFVEDRSERWQESDRGEAWAQVVSDLEDRETACDDLEAAPEIQL